MGKIFIDGSEKFKDVIVTNVKSKDKLKGKIIGIYQNVETDEFSIKVELVPAPTKGKKKVEWVAGKNNDFPSLLIDDNALDSELHMFVSNLLKNNLDNEIEDIIDNEPTEETIESEINLDKVINSKVDEDLIESVTDENVKDNYEKNNTWYYKDEEEIEQPEEEVVKEEEIPAKKENFIIRFFKKLFHLK